MITDNQTKQVSSDMGIPMYLNNPRISYIPIEITYIRSCPDHGARFVPQHA